MIKLFLCIFCLSLAYAQDTQVVFVKMGEPVLESDGSFMGSITKSPDFEKLNSIEQVKKKNIDEILYASKPSQSEDWVNFSEVKSPVRNNGKINFEKDTYKNINLELGMNAYASRFLELKEMYPNLIIFADQNLNDVSSGQYLIKPEGIKIKLSDQDPKLYSLKEILSLTKLVEFLSEDKVNSIGDAQFNNDRNSIQNKIQNLYFNADKSNNTSITEVDIN